MNQDELLDHLGLAANPLCWEAADEIRRLQLEVKSYAGFDHLHKLCSQQVADLSQLRMALGFYASPESYHALAIFADPPYGEFADDVSEVDHPHYDRKMHGALARRTLEALDRGKSDDDDEPPDLLLYEAWGLIANAYHGNWDEDPEWKAAAVRWRDKWHETLDHG